MDHVWRYHLDEERKDDGDAGKRQCPPPGHIRSFQVPVPLVFLNLRAGATGGQTHTQRWLLLSRFGSPQCQMGGRAVVWSQPHCFCHCLFCDHCCSIAGKLTFFLSNSIIDACLPGAEPISKLVAEGLSCTKVEGPRPPQGCFRFFSKKKVNHNCEKLVTHFPTITLAILPKMAQNQWIWAMIPKNNLKYSKRYCCFGATKGGPKAKTCQSTLGEGSHTLSNGVVQSR